MNRSYQCIPQFCLRCQPFHPQVEVSGSDPTDKISSHQNCHHNRFSRRKVRFEIADIFRCRSVNRVRKSLIHSSARNNPTESQQQVFRTGQHCCHLGCIYGIKKMLALKKTLEKCWSWDRINKLGKSGFFSSAFLRELSSCGWTN